MKRQTPCVYLYMRLKIYHFYAFLSVSVKNMNNSSCF